MRVAPNSLRYAAPTGSVLLRWDGSRQPVVWTVPPPEMDPVQARLELARRYLHIFAPSTASSFARWAGIGRTEASKAFAGLAGALTPVRTPVGDASILADDETAFRSTAGSLAAARLLPSGDAYFLLWGREREILVPDRTRRSQLWTPRVWPGAVLVSGEIAGVWRRSAADVSIQLWRRVSSAEWAALEAKDMSTSRLAALVVSSSFAAGLNVYATIATLGLLARSRAIELPASLDAVTSWWVIGASVALYSLEFVADKIPAVDLVWNALQTFVRVPVAAFVAYAATATLSPSEQLLAAAVGGGIALIAHGGKTAARVAVTPSPEPFSNIALSLGEDALVVFITWLAGRHPFVAAAIAIVLLAIIVVLARAVLRAVRTALTGARRQLSRV